MKRSFKLLFFLRKPQNYKSGPQPIYLRITFDGQRTEYAIQRECEPLNWNSQTGRMIGTREPVRILNAYLESISAKIYTFHNELMMAGLPISAEILKNRLIGKDVKSRMLIPIFQQHNKQMQELVGKEFAQGTVLRYATSLQHTIDFLQWKFNVSDIDVRAVNHEFITDYDFYLRSVKNCNNNTTVKYIKNFKKIINECLAKGWIEKNPFLNFKSKIIEVDRAFLSEEEIERLEKKTFSMERLNTIKQLFLFSCYTGLAFIDVQKLTAQNVVIGIDGKHWIKTHRTKTETASNIPLLPPAMAIINQFKEHPQVIQSGKLLPVPSNQKMNAYLKEIADLCEINKPLTFHVARHTFATTITLTNGIPIESVSKMLGHRSLRTTQHYAKILDKKVSEDMEVLFTKMTKKKSGEELKKMA